VLNVKVGILVLIWFFQEPRDMLEHYCMYCSDTFRLLKLMRQPWFLFVREVLGEWAVFVKLRIDDDKVNPAVPKRKVVVPEI
jgi:hypothetical protein